MKPRNKKRELLGGWITREQVRPLLCGRDVRFITEAMKVGAKTPTGGRIRLQCKILNGQYYTRPEWVEEFLAATTQAWLPEANEKQQQADNEQSFAKIKNRLKQRINKG